MGRDPRPTAAGLYHLMARSSTPDLLFRDGADCLSMIGQIERVTLDTDWTCLAVCLMGTHYHLVVDAGDDVLAGAMKRINWAYACRSQQAAWPSRASPRLQVRLDTDRVGGVPARVLSVRRSQPGRSGTVRSTGGMALEQLRRDDRAVIGVFVCRCDARPQPARLGSRNRDRTPARTRREPTFAVRAGSARGGPAGTS